MRRTSVRSILMLLWAANCSSLRCVWKKSHEAPKEKEVFLGLHVAIGNQALLKATYEAVSDPKSPRYREFLTGTQLKVLAGPSPQHSLGLRSFTEEHFGSLSAEADPRVVFSSIGNVAKVRLRVDEVERLLNTTCHQYYYLCPDKEGVLRNLSKPISATKTMSASLPESLAALSHLPRAEGLEEGAQVWMSGVVRFPVVPSNFLNFPSSLPKKFFRPDSDSTSLPHLPRPYLWIPNLSSRATVSATSPNREPASTRLMPEGFFDPVMAVFTSLNSISLYARVTCPDGSLAVYFADAQTVSCSQGLGHLQRNLDSIIVTLTSTAGSKTYTFTTSKLRCSFNRLNPQAPVDCLEVMTGVIPYARYAISVRFNFLDQTNKETSGYVYNLQYFIAPGPQLKPAFARSLYGVPDSYLVEKTTAQAIAAIETPSPTGTGFFSKADLIQFYKNCSITTSPEDVTYKFPGGTWDETRPDEETSLDVQWESGIAQGATTVAWHTNQNSGWSLTDVLQQILDAVIKNQTQVRVLSISYGSDEINFQDAELEEIENNLMMLGVHGVTILAASGDHGAFTGGTGTEEAVCSSFEPNYPASSQYVTAVGATQLLGNQVEAGCMVTEAVCSHLTGALITGGGGFSKRVSSLPEQAAAVKGWVDEGKTPPSSMFDVTKRAYPDISLVGHNLFVVVNQTDTTIDGTSGSSPIMGGLVTILNNAFRKKGGKSIGPLNKLLYTLHQSHPEVFNDVVRGSNSCTNSFCCDKGFSATEGWDPASGLGSLNLVQFSKVLEGLSPQGIPGSLTPIKFPATVCGSPPLPDNSPVDDEEHGFDPLIILPIIMIIVLVVVFAVCMCRRIKKKRAARLIDERVGNLQDAQAYDTTPYVEANM